MLNLTILNDAKFAAMCSFDKNTNIEIADNIIQSFADASLTKIEDKIAILTTCLQEYLQVKPIRLDEPTS